LPPGGPPSSHMRRTPRDWAHYTIRRRWRTPRERKVETPKGVEAHLGTAKAQRGSAHTEEEGHRNGSAEPGEAR
jgi:hypothetical protein